MLGLFSLSGQVLQSGMGILPLTWGELRDFREENELDLTLWEREMLKKMSEAYCSEYHLASSPTRPAPYKPEVEEEEIDHIGRAMHFREQLLLLKARKEQ